MEAKESVKPKEAAGSEAVPETVSEESKDVPLAVPEPPAEVQVVTPVKKTKDLGKTPSKPEKQKKEKKQAKGPESDKVPAEIASEELRVCLQNHHELAVSKPSEDLQRFTVGGFGFRLRPTSKRTPNTATASTLRSQQEDEGNETDLQANHSPTQPQQAP